MAEKCAAKKGEESKDCLFCKFARKEIETAVVYEDKKVFAFLDIDPAGPLIGHTLVIPKRHSHCIDECPDEDLKAMIVAVKKIMPALKKVSGAEGVNLVQNNGKAAGQFVMHAHFHVIPRKQGDGIWFNENRRKAVPMELTETAKAIREEMAKKK